MAAPDQSQIGPSPTAPQLVGRARELAQIEAMLEGVDALPAAVALVGEASPPRSPATR
ncbi:MAG TPA: hypothetical protein VMP67_01200 [Candidatus Limnocylindria bacterium]|nr:hypothetical protein [Candidatus Limnocylindria bacterium]